jgi:D-alanyl-D-alanine carboxypeptidase
VIIKSFLILSILFNFIGMHGMADKFDNAVVREWSGNRKEAMASDYSIALPDIMPLPQIRAGAPKATANARHYILADLETGKILASKDENAHVPIASTTKIMTAVLALEDYKLDDVVTISAAASTQIGADTYLQPGEKITVENLLNCLLIKSGNDAAYALAENMNDPGETGVTKFVAAMNKKAKELGMKDSEYHDPAGLDVTGYVSAHDLFLVTKHALTFDTFREIVKKDKASVTNVNGTIWHQLDQSNRLVGEYKYPGAMGVKTGYMPEAGHCLVGAATRDGHTLVAIDLNTYLDSASASADEAKRLLDWGFANVKWE